MADGGCGHNGILQRANYALVTLAKDLGRTGEVERLEGWIKKTQAGMKYLWNGARNLCLL